eukprot:s250_g13.t3
MRFGGYSGFTWLNDFHSFNFDTSTWQAVPSGHKGSVPSTRFGYVSAVHGDFMYVFGGYDGSAWLNDMFDFDFERGAWFSTQVQGFIPSGRSCPSWATHNGSVYLFGGYDGVHRMNDFHQFRMASRTWSSVRSAGQVPSPRYFHASVVYGNSLFLFGGYSGQERLNDLYEFRFDCHTWFVLSTEDPPSGRSSLVAEVFNNSLYVFGGYNGSIISLHHAVAGTSLAELELPHGSTVLDLYAAASAALERHSSTLHLVKDGRDLRGPKGAESLQDLGPLEKVDVIFVPGSCVMAAVAGSVWHLGLAEEPKVIYTSPDPDHTVDALIFARDAELLAVRTKSCVRCSMKLLDLVASKLALLDGEKLKVFDLHLKECILEAVGCFEICSFSSDGLYVITGGDCDSPPAVWNLTSKEDLLLTAHVTDGFFTSCIFSPDASMVVTASREPNWEEVYLWSQDGTLMHRLPTWAIYNMVPGAEGGKMEGHPLEIMGISLEIVN